MTQPFQAQQPSPLLADHSATLAKMEQALDPASQVLIEKALELEKWPLAQLVSIFERHTEANLIKRHQIQRELALHPKAKSGCVFGFTGTPGAGKSSLIGALCLNLLEQTPDLSIAVVAIDPSSQASGGALLGDRTRTQFPAQDKRVFFRSQASHLDLGGMGKTTYSVVRLLKKLFDIVIIETVGIGQSEIEVQRLADHTILVMQPLAGDQVQFMKAGIMEVPDTFVINKCDEDKLAKKSLHLLKASLKLAKIYIHNDPEQQQQDIFMCSATKLRGINELASKLLTQAQTSERKNASEQAQYFLDKAIRQNYGELGLKILARNKAMPTSTPTSSYEALELSCVQIINQALQINA